MAQIYTPAPVVLPTAHDTSAPYHRRPLEDPYLAARPQSPKDHSPTSITAPRRASGWESPKPRSPTSERRDMNGRGAPSREQLPPISSLFGPGLHQNTHSASPFTEGPSPIYPSPSSHDSRSPHTALGPPERSLDSSLRRASVSHPSYSWSPRQEHGERASYAAAPRPGPLETRQESPRYDGQYNAPERLSQQQPGPNHWQSSSDPHRADYFPPRDTSSSFARPTSEQYGSATQQAQRPEPEPRIIFCDVPSSGNSNHHINGHSAPSNANNGMNTHPNSNNTKNPISPISSYPPATPTMPSDPTVTKDGLGPKIWTGTQFLPRFVRQAEVPGEGLCYFYDDGSHCKTVIDGEVVNAHWGVTKAGKPRKRLAIACITCREKKIKCDPDFPRCVQCEKFGRVCKFKNAPRGGQGGSPDTPPDDADEPPRPGSSRADNASFRGEKRQTGHSSPGPTSRQESPESDVRSTKRRRQHAYGEYTPVASEASPRTANDTSPTTPWVEPNVHPIDHSLVHDWQINPYAVNSSLTNELLSLYFLHFPETAYSFFPEGPFRAWVASPAEKSLDDLMVIYAVLAISSIFSPNAEYKHRATRYAAIARYGSDHRQFSIQLVQTRLMLSLYYFANNNPNDSWDLCGAGLRAASGLKLNLEIEKTYDNSLQTFPYGLNRDGYAECRRRTFWSCFMMDRLNGFCSGNLTTINPEDVFLRFPCNTRSFEQQLEVRNPFFRLSELPPPPKTGEHTMGRMAYMVEICSIWGDIMAHIYRASQLAPLSASDHPAVHSPQVSSSSRAFYDNSVKRLEHWQRSLPAELACSSENFARAVERGRIGLYTMMHAMFFVSHMRLHRFHDLEPLMPAQISKRITIVRENAHAFMELMTTVSLRRSASHTPLKAPFIGFTVASAVDVLTASFVPSTIPPLLPCLKGGQAVLAELAQTWQSARNQQAQVGQRIHEAVEISRHGPVRNADGTSGVKGIYTVSRTGVVSMDKAIDNTFHLAPTYDLVYHGISMV